MNNLKQIRIEKFESLMNDINTNYAIGKNVYFDTLEGKKLATITEHNESKFLGSCSVTFDLGNGTFNTQMFTI